ncbi:hypothetical protein CFE70_006010 [Pyrenophora teres f. teres 0-1]|uniref:Uncharacterized protein n=1 Tax=Pyrenophora teres f. teres (strain 0-1) TaxID=861557 RepID=E3RR16_PYRTT|nr:hypothetical protein PTT_11219 [Pyrenophora teres f. teres 0-1]
MVAALAYPFTAVFPDRKTPAIFNEVHGREVSDGTIDLTRTVGWFTKILFNYQGLYQQLERKDSLFKNLLIPEGCEPALAASCLRFAIFDVSLVIEQGCAKITFIRDRRANYQDRIRQWMRQYTTTLIDMLALLSNRSAEWTLSDLPLSFSSYIDLDRFRHKTLLGLEVCPEDVEDVFPCSPMQEGILTSQGKDIDFYWICLIYEVMPN